jgi:hypothetical protein
MRTGCFFFELVLILWLIRRKYCTRPGLIGCQSNGGTKEIQQVFRGRKIVEEIKKRRGSQGIPSLSSSRIRDLFRSGSSTLDPDNRRLLPGCDPVSTSDIDGPGDREGNRGPLATLPAGTNRPPPPMIPGLGTIVIRDGPAGPGKPASIDI